MKSLVLFLLGALLFGAVALGIGYAVAGDDSLLQGGIAFLLTFVPAALTLAWVVFSGRAEPNQQLLASLAGSGIRMAVVLGGGIGLTRSMPPLFDDTFWYWLVLFYLVFLGLEIALLVRQQPRLDDSSHP